MSSNDALLLKVKGLKEALENDNDVVSIYSPEYVKKVFPAIKNFKGGNAIFTFPKVPIKCPGKLLCFLFHSYKYLIIKSSQKVLLKR